MSTALCVLSGSDETDSSSATSESVAAERRARVTETVR